jgi:NADH-quinone oxidoreductase subunit I
VRSVYQCPADHGNVLSRLRAPRATVQYPEEKPYLPPRWRGRIILSRDPDGEERCVACYLCAVACPVDCIALQATEDEHGRRYPEFFRINFSRCIFCGFCEEACPTYAIQLTPDFEMSEYKRQNMVYEKEDLLIDGAASTPATTSTAWPACHRRQGQGRGAERDPPVDVPACCAACREVRDRTSRVKAMG